MEASFNRSAQPGAHSQDWKRTPDVQTRISRARDECFLTSPPIAGVRRDARKPPRRARGRSLGGRGVGGHDCFVSPFRRRTDAVVTTPATTRNLRRGGCAFELLPSMMQSEPDLKFARLARRN